MQDAAAARAVGISLLDVPQGLVGDVEYASQTVAFTLIFVPADQFSIIVRRIHKT